LFEELDFEDGIYVIAQVAPKPRAPRTSKTS